MTKYTVATVKGSNLETVKGIVAELGANLVVVDNPTTALTIPFDRLLLLGGADISSFWYGQAANGAKKPNQQRDFTEWALLRRAMTFMTPTLGICRGMQFMAVASGGTLCQDMAAAGQDKHPKDDGVCHRLPAVSEFLHPYLPLRKPKQGDPYFAVNSTHHQCVIDTGSYEACAWSTDGTIEAIYKPCFLGVQWHPEKLVETDERWMKLFRWWMEGLC